MKGLDNVKVGVRLTIGFIIMAVIAAAIGVLILSSQFSKSSHLKGISRVASAMADLGAIFCLLTLGLSFVVPRLAAAIGGLDERIFLAMVLLWMAVVSIHLLQSKRSTG